MILGTEQCRFFEKNGYYFPVRVLSEQETAEYQARFLGYLSQNQLRLRSLLPREQFVVLGQTHTFLRWVYAIASHPAVLDAVEGVLGKNLLAWDSRWFSKMPGEKTYVGWHQDGEYWGLRPPKVVTAWIALTESSPKNGCMRVIPGTHRGPGLPHRENNASESGLSRGQEIAIQVDESQAIDIILRPGEMSLHHIGIVHGSKANESDRPRIGLAVRYVTPDVVQEAPERPFALLVRGKDECGHFEILDPPTDHIVSIENAIQAKVLRRLIGNLRLQQRLRI